MANRAPVLALLGLLALLGAGGVWWALQGALDGDPPAESGPTAGARARSDTELLEANPGRQVQRATEVELATPSDPGTRENFGLADAIFVDVTVVRPAGTPADEALELIAFSAKDADGTEGRFESEGLTQQLQRFGAPVASEVRKGVSDAAEGRTFALRDVTDDTVRVPFHADTFRGQLILSGRYLYLEKAITVDLAGGTRAVTLEPLLGARIHGELRLPTTAAARGISADDLTALVHLAGMDAGGRRAGQARQLRSTAEIDGSQGVPEYAFDALPADMTYFVVVDPDPCAGARRMGVPLRAGDSTQVDFDLTLGVRVTGRVVDGDSTPVESAVLFQTGLSATIFTRLSRKRVESAGDGRFVLDGLEPGEVEIRAGKQGWVSTDHGPISAEEGSEHDVGDLVLDPGEALAGSVRWPDGRSADGAQVRILKAFGGEARHVLRTGSTDAQGTFSFAGLLAGPYEVVAALAPDGKTEGPGVWRASTAGKVDAQAEVELVLVEPLGISGIVRDDLGQPVNRFEVRAAYAGATEEDGAWGAYTEITHALESDDGSFSLHGLYAGPHAVSVSAAGHAESPRLSCLVPQEGGPLEVVMQRTGAAEGIVLDPSGQPVQGAAVYARQGAPEPMMGWGSGADTVRTDARGAFRVTDLVAGAHAVGAGHLDWADAIEVPIEVEPGQLVSGITLPLRIGATITGEVYDADGFPMPGRQVSYSKTMLMGFGSGLESRTSDASGAFRFEHVTPGEWTVSASPSFEEQMEALRTADENTMMNMMSRILTAKVTVADGEEAYVRLGSVPRVPVRLHGSITRAGAPVKTTLYAVAEGGSLFSGLKACDSDERGIYETVLERPGPYMIGVEGTTGAIEFHVDVPEAESHELHLALPNGVLAGTVLGPDGAPEPDVRVALFETSGISRLSRLDGTTRRTGAGGTFEFVDLRGGTYVLRASVVGNSSDATGAYGSIVSEPLQLEEDGTLTDIDLHLAQAGSIEGVVRDAAGAPVADAGVYVRNANGALLSPFPRATTDALGRFTYTNVAPGEVTVSARTKGSASSETGPIVVRSGEASGVELTLEEATVLVVTVQDEAGDDVRAAISVTDAGGREMSGMLSPDFYEDAVTEGFSTRELRVGPLPAGRFTVVATAEDGRSRKKRVTVRGKPETRVRIKLKD